MMINGATSQNWILKSRIDQTFLFPWASLFDPDRFFLGSKT